MDGWMCMCMCIHISIYPSIYLSIYIYLHIHMCMCIYIYILIDCMYIYIYTYNLHTHGTFGNVCVCALYVIPISPDRRDSTESRGSFKFLLPVELNPSSGFRASGLGFKV